MTDNDVHWMKMAAAEARRAAEMGEVPVGACVVDAKGTLLGAAANRTIADNDPTAHAEVLAIRAAARTVGNYRLTDTTLYSTIEPCVMCAGALVNARIGRLVFGARDERFGAVQSVFQLCDNALLNHRMEIVSGVLADECRLMMQEFFRARRPGADG